MEDSIVRTGSSRSRSSLQPITAASVNKRPRVALLSLGCEFDPDASEASRFSFGRRIVKAVTASEPVHRLRER
jgi:hypothetical protein